MDLGVGEVERSQEEWREAKCVQNTLYERIKIINFLFLKNNSRLFFSSFLGEISITLKLGGFLFLIMPLKLHHLLLKYKGNDISNLNLKGNSGDAVF